MSAARPSLPKHSGFALSQAVSAACDEFTTGPECDVGHLWSTIYGVVNCTVQSSIRMRNASHAPIMRMPQELLCATLRLLSLEDRAAAAQVCHWFRDASDATPIDINSGDQTLWSLRGLLAQTGHAPLEFERVAYVNLHRTADVLLQHMHRIRRMSIAPLKARAELPAAFLRLLQAPVPQLRTFCLEFDSKTPRRLGVDGLFVEDGAPLLHTCILKHVTDGLAMCSSLENLRQLGFAGSVSRRDLQLILVALVHLERLDLRITSWKESASNLHHPPIVPPPRLGRLTLDSTSYDSPARPLHFAMHALILHISIWFSSPTHERRQSLENIIEEVNAATNYVESHVESVEIRTMTDNSAPMRAPEHHYVISTCDSLQRRRVFANIPHEHVPDILQQCVALRDTVSLAVNTPDVLLGTIFGEMQYLTLVKPPSDWNPNQGSRQRMIFCPALQHVTLTGRGSMPAWFPRFCVSTLSRGLAPKLRVIDVRGIRTRQLPNDFGALATVANVVTFGAAIHDELVSASSYTSLLQ